jgi:hypothetical protein
MKKATPFTIILMVTASLSAADSPRDTLVAAARKLATSDNYSWKILSEAGPHFEGKTEKDGFTLVNITDGSLTLSKGTNAAFKPPDGEWQSVADTFSGDANGDVKIAAFRALMNTPFPPAQEIEALVEQLGNITVAKGVYSSTLTEESAKHFAPLSYYRLVFGRAGNLMVTGTKGSARFWITDGLLTKIELPVQGELHSMQGLQEINRTATTTFKDIGNTKVELPDEAKKKVS